MKARLRRRLDVERVCDLGAERLGEGDAGEFGCRRVVRGAAFEHIGLGIGGVCVWLTALRASESSC